MFYDVNRYRNLGQSGQIKLDQNNSPKVVESASGLKKTFSLSTKAQIEENRAARRDFFQSLLCSDSMTAQKYQEKLVGAKNCDKPLKAARVAEMITDLDQTTAAKMDAVIIGGDDFKEGICNEIAAIIRQKAPGLLPDEVTRLAERAFDGPWSSLKGRESYIDGMLKAHGKGLPFGSTTLPDNDPGRNYNGIAEISPASLGVTGQAELRDITDRINKLSDPALGLPPLNFESMSEKDRLALSDIAKETEQTAHLFGFENEKDKATIMRIAYDHRNDLDLSVRHMVEKALAAVTYD